MTPDTLVDIASHKEIAEALQRALSNLGITLEELRAQAEADEFQSDDARHLWFAIRDLVATV